MNAQQPTQDDSSEQWQFAAASERETELLGEALGTLVEPGTVIALVGELGAGKTRLVQAIAAGMGVERRLVNSPTFILIQEYRGRLPIYHFDTYRLGSVEEFLDLGAEEIIAGGGVCLIEWADRVADVLPPDHLRIEIAITGRETREFCITASGPTSQGLLARLRQRL